MSPFLCFIIKCWFDLIVSPWLCIAVVRKPPCELHIFLASTTAESRAKIVCQWNAFGSPGGLGCCPFLGGGSVAFLSIVLYISHCVWGFCVCLCFVMHYCVSILLLQSVLKRKNTLVALFWLSYQFLVNVNALRLFLMVPCDGPVCSV